MRTVSAPVGLMRETLLALLVVSLAFLNFGHSSAVFAAGGRVVVTTVSICGDPSSGPAAGEHFACHACRPAIAILPPAPAMAEPVCFAVAPVDYGEAVPLAPYGPLLLAAKPRGPPMVA